MNLRLIREPSISSATLGCLFVDGHFACFTLEDVIRETPGQPVRAWKVPGRTAIPAGRYRIIRTMSERFRKVLPLLLAVNGFDGIRIHAGNGPLDTEGCILVGKDRRHGTVLQSRVALAALDERLSSATGETWITIVNPAEAQAA